MAERLKRVLPEIVFVDGCTTGLLITDPAASPVRATDDVDVIVEVASYAEYARFSKRLRNLGFSEDSSEGAPICRWLIDRMKLDVMPTDETILGFSNRWYKPAIEAAAIVALDGFELRVVTTPYFIGTKLEAFRVTGKGDFYASSDLEDIIMSLTVVPRLWKMSPIPLANSAATSARKSEGCSTTGNLLTPCQDI
jgi:predicted nucleotidyltransferase